MINITQDAVDQILSLDGPNVIRVRVTGGGCSGMSYKLDFMTEQPDKTDLVFKRNSVTIVVDVKSHIFLDETVLDYSGELNGKGFIFENPNAVRNCGCGSSFSI